MGKGPSSLFLLPIPLQVLTAISLYAAADPPWFGSLLPSLDRWPIHLGDAGMPNSVISWRLVGPFSWVSHRTTLLSVAGLCLTASGDLRQVFGMADGTERGPARSFNR